MTTKAGFIGFAPKVAVTNIRPDEKTIYTEMWNHPEYRGVAPGQGAALDFIKQSRLPFGSKVVDLGCGTGRGSAVLAQAGMDVTLVDFAVNCLDVDVKENLGSKFVEADLTKPLPVSAPYGFCTDVMEHIPPEQVDAVLNNCLLACKNVFFQIATEDDIWGDKLIGHKLHLSVHPYEWWLQKFNDRGCVIQWSRNDGNSCMFLVSGWATGEDVLEVGGKLNVEHEEAVANIKANIAGDWLQVEPYDRNNLEVMIVGGGPSVKYHWEDIEAKRKAGMPLIALNGSYDECLKRGITPSALVIVDAREFNARFTRNVVDNCKYFIASQCHPSVLEGLPRERTFLWHAGAAAKEALIERYGEGKCYPVSGGSTVLLRSIVLFRMLGFCRFHMYGCDSCLEDEVHHAYEQKENDNDIVLNISCGDKIFKCNPWMVVQAQEFIETIKVFGEVMELEVYGDGLLGHILKTGADLYDNGPQALK